MRATSRYYGGGLLLSALFACGGGAQAAEQSMWDVAFGATATSNYMSRGTTQTDDDPALQGFAEITGGQFYFGTFISNVNYGFPDTEIDLSAGWRPEVGNFSFDFGAVEYLYVTDSGSSYPELYGFAKYKVNDMFTMGSKLYYAPDYSQLGFSALYAEANTSISLREQLQFLRRARLPVVCNGWPSGLPDLECRPVVCVEIIDVRCPLLGYGPLRRRMRSFQHLQQFLRCSRRCIGFARY